MAKVQITIHDIDTNNIGVDVSAFPMLPESRILWTNAQMIATDVVTVLQNLGKQINSRSNQEQLVEASKLTV